MKPMTVLLTAALLSISSISACSNSENSMNIQQETEAKFHLNPQPKQAYRLKITPILKKMCSLISIKSMSLNMNPLYMQMLF